MNIVRRDQFLGANNIAKPERLPEGAVADAVNFDFTVGGKAELRAGFEKIRDGKLRAIFAAGDDLILVDDDHIIKYSHGVETQLCPAPAGRVAATWHNSELYMSTEQGGLVLGDTAKQWGIKAPAFTVSVVSGNATPGIYKVAVTRVDNDRESGCVPAVVRLSEGQAIQIETEGGADTRLYCSVANGLTLYHQGSASSTNIITAPSDDSARLETALLEPMPDCSILSSMQGLILGAQGSTLYHTRPMIPHLHNPETDFIQLPAPITLIAPVLDGCYVCADKTYFITGIGGAELVSRVVFDFGAIPGTYVQLPDATAGWFTRYGQVIAGPEGQARLMHAASYSPETASAGASGFIEHNGNQLIATNMRGETGFSSLQSRDHWDLEII